MYRWKAITSDATHTTQHKTDSDSDTTTVPLVSQSARPIHIPNKALPSLTSL